MKRSTLILILIIVLIAAIASYWYFFIHSSTQQASTGNTSSQNGFSPINSTFPSSGNGTNAQSNSASSTQTQNNQSTATSPIPTLRLLSNTPVGGYGAFTNSTTTVVRWIDRGRGNIYQIDEDSLAAAVTLSNTLLPMVYQSSWNQNLTAFIGTILENNAPVTLYAALLPQATSTATSTNGAAVTLAPFELRGGNLPANTITYAVSPKKDKIFFMTDESGVGVGYVANFNGSGVARIFSTPLLQVTADWPETNTIAITTKASATQNGFLYFVNPQTGTWRKILGPLAGMSARVSHDAKYAIVSVTGNDSNVLTYIYTVGNGSSADALVHTVADKCAWGNFYKDIVYCAASSVPIAATYPDDWYRGTISESDEIWQIDATTGQVHLVSSIVDQSDRVIDGFDLGLDDKDNYLFFMNKNDLSLWSLDLVSSN